MECPFHAGNEAITTCVQCETPICPLCASETNQVHLCLNCYQARVEELSASLGSASARLAKGRKKTEAKASPVRKKKRGETPLEPAPTAKAAYELGTAESLWEKDGADAVTPGEMVPPLQSDQPMAAPIVPIPAEAAPSKKELARMQKEEAKRLKEEEKAAKKAKAPVAGTEQLVAPAPAEAAPSKKELARMQKEEAKRLKEEEKAAKKAAKAGVPEAPAEAPSMPEPAPFFEPSPEPPSFTPPQPEAAPQSEVAAPPPPLNIPPLDFPTEPAAEGVKIPRMDEKLEPLPPPQESGGFDSTPGAEPPDGFFD